jgi:hypothetical protein
MDGERRRAAPPVDDPSAGRRLNRRLAVVLPVAAVVGAIIGLPFAIALSDWRPIVAAAAVAVALAGTVAAAMEDGRVQRRIDAVRSDPGLDRARTAALRDDQEAVREEAARALARGISPEAVADAVGHPAWPAERVAALGRELETAR